MKHTAEGLDGKHSRCRFVTICYRVDVIIGGVTTFVVNLDNVIAGGALTMNSGLHNTASE